MTASKKQINAVQDAVISNGQEPHDSHDQGTTLAHDLAPKFHEPDSAHVPDTYDDVPGLEYPSALYTAMEQHLPADLLKAARAEKIAYMDKILAKYRPDAERARKHREYRERIQRQFKPLHGELYGRLDPERVFAASFAAAVAEGTEAAFRRVLTEHAPGVFSFPMLRPAFCSMLIEEVQHFERWAAGARVKIMRPNTMNNYGAVLDDIGLEPLLAELMRSHVSPLTSRGHFRGSRCRTLAAPKALNRSPGFHVDDSEVTLNVCLGKQFAGGELFLRGVRCQAHVNGESRPEEVLEYAQVAGQAVLHAGRHRHGAKPITGGQRVNLILWCRSSEFREMTKYQREFPAWCGECVAKKRERRRLLSCTQREQRQQATSS
eukprot:jgi/Mesen1/3362/ME000191S02499